MQSVSSRIWTRDAVSISYDDNHYTTGISTFSYNYAHKNTGTNTFYKEMYQMKLYIYIMVKVFARGPRNHGSIPGRVIPKTQKMVLDASLLNTLHYKVRIKGKRSNSGKGIAPSSTPR